MSKEQADTIFSLAVELLRKNLDIDRAPGSYYDVMKANIAMAFMDELPSGLREHAYEEMHAIANRAADRFLNNFIGKQGSVKNG